MKKIIYDSQDNIEKFDIDRFKNSLCTFANIKTEDIEKALEDFVQYETMHVSCLVEIGTKLIAEKADEKTAKKYFDKYAEYFDEGKFERLRRITGYLVGTLDRWNDAKKAEEAARVKHNVEAKECVNSALNDVERLAELETQAMNQNIAYTLR